MPFVSNPKGRHYLWQHRGLASLEERFVHIHGLAKLGVWRLSVYVDPHYTTFVDGVLIEKKKISNLNHPNPNNTSFLPESREDKTEGRFCSPTWQLPCEPWCLCLQAALSFLASGRTKSSWSSSGEI